MHITIRRNLITTLLTALLAIGLAGCSSHKKATASGSEYTPAPDETPQITSVAESYIYGLSSSYDNWEYLALPVNVELTSPQRLKLSGRMYMERGKSIYVSMRFLGMEVATLYLTNDSIYATEKMHKYLLAESVDNLLGGCDLTIDNIQDLMLGRAFIAGKSQLLPQMAKDVTITTADGSYDWSFTPASIKGYTYQFNVTPNPQHVQSIDFKQGNTLRATCTYSQPTRTRCGMMANSLSINAPLRSDELRVNLTLNLSDSKWSESDMRQWTMPKGYTRLSRRDIMSMFTSF